MSIRATDQVTTKKILYKCSFILQKVFNNEPKVILLKEIIRLRLSEYLGDEYSPDIHFAFAE